MANPRVSTRVTASMWGEQAVCEVQAPSEAQEKDSTLSFPGAREFNESTERWDIFQAPSFAAALAVGSEEDLVAAVKLATSYNIPFLATGTRHGYGNTIGELQDGLALDLSPLNSIVVDANAETVTVGPGVFSVDVFDPVFEAGYSMPTGTCSCVGLIGATLGAGIGRLSGTHGLMIDALLSVRIVTADGSLLTASETSNSDLFWAIRGAGANFGIITSATYRITPITSTYTNVQLIFPAGSNGTVLDWFATVDISAKWAIGVTMAFNAEAGAAAALFVSAVYYGPREEALAVLDPILHSDPGPIFFTAEDVPWNRLTTSAGFGTDAQTCAKGSIHDIHGVNIRDRDAETLREVFELLNTFYAEYPAGRGVGVGLEGWSNEAVVAVPDEETAFPWRDTQIYTLIQAIWTPGNTATQNAVTSVALDIRSRLAATSGYGDLSVYVNYAIGDETLEQRYGKRKLPRLSELKRRYDPGNVFRFHHALPSEYP
ncbi:hypothetical protein BJX66DRAFT_326833 [Aspergillus keveii]|uniref:FAD-binding PCMH-type domain-containing protein n=1 Tax=Aspergillus keveii TaxID=714993 RepID=A0ABR4FZX5_9EURO